MDEVIHQVLKFGSNFEGDLSFFFCHNSKNPALWSKIEKNHQFGQKSSCQNYYYYYIPELFEQASNVLLKIGQGELETYLQNVAAKVNKSAENQRVDEELFADAPDEYLDSIMSHLMTDPVRLPNSLQIVDRSTIARHLLSDQNDPFTRAPLTMEQIEPLDDLKYEIQKWMEDKRKNQSI